MAPTVRAGLVAAAVGLAAALVTFGASSGALDAWHGQVVAARPAASEEAATRRVTIAAPSGSVQRDWPRDVVDRLSVPATFEEPIAGPRTKKLRGALSFEVEGVDGPVGSARPVHVGLALLAALVAVALRNMAAAGAPWRLVRDPREPRLERLAPSGVPVRGPLEPTSRSKPGPPPSHARPGRGRR